MSLDSAIARFRGKQQSLFRDNSTVTRLINPEFDPLTGDLVTQPTTIHSGPCLARPAALEATDRQYGDTNVSLRRSDVKFPPNTPIEYGDVVVLSASTFDVGLVGVPMRVIDIARDGWQIARVCKCEEIME